MGILDELRAESGVRRDRLAEILAQLPEDEREDVRAALLDPSISTTALVKVLRRRGIDTTKDSIYNLRRRMRDGNS
jgi:hypothetical protein